MATTTNFGWETPDDTDLVKDGALAIRTLGNSIDTSLVDLKGGTTGQVLSKTSNTDMDFTWVAQDDSNAIQNAIVDAKGDLISATAADTPARLAVGTDGQILTADSTTATGLKWATASGGFTFSTYTPTYTNFTLGNGTLNVARYAQSGKLVYFQVQITLGSTSSISGLVKISLPVTPKNNGNAVTIPALFTDAGLNEYIGFGSIDQTNSAVTLFAQNSSGTYLTYALTSSTVPFTWGNADVINVSGNYEAN